MTASEGRARRPPGTGSLLLRTDSAGRETWYGKFRVGGRQVKRKLGLRRVSGSTVGLTRRQAEAELRRLIAETRPAPIAESISFSEAAERYVRHVEIVMERKPSTVEDYKIIVHRHLAPFFAGMALGRIESDHVVAYMSSKRRTLATKTVANHLNLLHGIFKHAVKRGWAASNPVANVDRPRGSASDPDIRYLDRTELDALIRAVPNDLLGHTDRVLYRTAAMTGLRQGELVALRWRDVDWAARLVRVRRSYSRGRYGPPKSRRSSRAVPLTDGLAGELDRHYQRSRCKGDDDLVFCHPETGGPYDASRMRGRFHEALRRADLRPIRFHDLRHTFGTQMAAAGAPLRALQEWMGHRDYKTTSVYADYAPDSSQGAIWAERAFGTGHRRHLAGSPRLSTGSAAAERPLP